MVQADILMVCRRRRAIAIAEPLHAAAALLLLLGSAVAMAAVVRCSPDAARRLLSQVLQLGHHQFSWQCPVVAL